MNEVEQVIIMSLCQNITNLADQKIEAVENHLQESSQQTSITKLNELFNLNRLILENKAAMMKLAKKVMTIRQYHQS